MKIISLIILELIGLLTLQNYQEELGRPLTVTILIVLAIVVIKLAIKMANKK